MFPRRKHPKIPKTDGTEPLTAFLGEEYFWAYPDTAGCEILLADDKTPQYCIREPKLTKSEGELLERFIRDTRNLLAKTSAEYTKEAMQNAADKILLKAGIPKNSTTAKKLCYYLETTLFGWGKLELLRHDPEIEDISCVGWEYPVYLYHRRYRDMQTNIRFDSEAELEHMIQLFAQKAGKQISLTNPIVDGTLEDGSRIQLSCGSAVSSRGPAFTIRRFRETPYSVTDLIQNRTFTLDEMVYLWFAVEYGQSILIIGGTASGKTTTLNALSQFIPPLAKIVTIEDTRELMLCHGNWLPSVVPPAGSRETITLFDLVSAAMRQRPEYLIVGEVRGEETAAMFQAINTGHTSLSTFHAGDFRNAVNRLENPPLSIPRAMIESLDVVLSQKRIIKDGMQIRRVSGIVEIDGMTPQNDLNVRRIFTYRNQEDDAVCGTESAVYAKIRAQTGMTAEELEAEITRRKQMLSRMLREGILEFAAVSKYIDSYMTRRRHAVKTTD